MLVQYLLLIAVVTQPNHEQLFPRAGRPSAPVGSFTGRSQNNLGVIIGLAVGIPVLLIGLTLWWYCYRKKKKLREQEAYRNGTWKAKNSGVGMKRRKKQNKLAAWFFQEK